MNKFALVFLLSLSACQTLPLKPTLPNILTIQSHKQSPSVGTAKEVYLEVQFQVEQKSSAYWLTHIQGTNISANGHNAKGQWIFSYIHLDNGKAIQVVANPKGILIKDIPAAQLPMKEPLEDRAWGFDSNKILSRFTQQNGSYSLELKTHNERLTWVVYTPNPVFIDAMTGKLTPHNKG